RENHRGTTLTGTFGNLRGRVVTVNRSHMGTLGNPRRPRNSDDPKDDERRDFGTIEGRRYAASVGANLGRTWVIHGGWAAHDGGDTGSSDALISAGVQGPITEKLRAHLLGARDVRTDANAFEVG